MTKVTGMPLVRQRRYRAWVFVTTVPLSSLMLANLIVAWRAPGTLPDLVVGLGHCRAGG